MKRNISTADRVIRIVVAIVIAALYFSGTLSGTWALVLGVVAVAFIVTGLVGTCPIYLGLGLSTFRRSV